MLISLADLMGTVFSSRPSFSTEEMDVEEELACDMMGEGADETLVLLLALSTPNRETAVGLSMAEVVAILMMLLSIVRIVVI